MNAAQIAKIREWIKEQKPVFYKSPHDDTTHRITRIEEQWEEWDGAPLEPALRLSGGKFAALCNVEPTHIVFIVPAFTVTEKANV
ncbi:hypothetical protein PQR05_29480 [Paraburkholderia sediminicola]|uniref:hypothetical protein n=1 Tax=Paraburkholderia sediminicola TaxID=458836 RepID=UPI0038B935D6